MKQNRTMAMKLAVVLTALGLSPDQVRAEVPPLDNKAQKERATDIIIGDVRKVETIERTAKDGSDTVYRFEISVVASEKGERWRKGDRLEATCWKIKMRPAAWTGETGQWFIPKPGQRIRAYLHGQDLLSPNGCDVVIAHQLDLQDLGSEPAEAKSDSAWLMALIAGGVCLAGGFVTGRCCSPKPGNRTAVRGVSE